MINFYFLALCAGHRAVAKNAKAGQCGATSRAASQTDTHTKKSLFISLGRTLRPLRDDASAGVIGPKKQHKSHKREPANL